MPQPKSSPKSSRSSAGSSPGRSATAAKRAKGSTSAKGAAAKRSRATPKRASAPSAGRDTAATLRDMIHPLNLVLITRERIQDALDDAVRRGRVTRGDAEDLVSELLKRGRKQTEDILEDLDRRAKRQRGDARRRAAGAGRAARSTVVRAGAADRVLREVDRARRAAGLPPSFPVIGYDDLAAAQIIERLDDLSPAQLRKVRDHERRNANRKTVLNAIERKLA
jgi:polyhydroxyalkanoate synthesis regulator phasin